MKAGRLPHIHLLVTAAGHEQLTTQHYPRPDENEAVLDLPLASRPNINEGHET